MRLSQPGGSDLEGLGLGLEGFDVAHAAVSHAAAQAARHLEDHVGHGPLVRDAALDPFRHELGRRHLALLEVAVAGAFFHGAQAPHAADHFEAPSLEQERLPDRKSTRLNSSHLGISYAVFCLKKKKTKKKKSYKP